LKEKSAVSLEELSFSEARKFLDRKIDECKIEEALALTEVRERIKRIWFGDS